MTGLVGPLFVGLVFLTLAGVMVACLLIGRLIGNHPERRTHDHR